MLGPPRRLPRVLRRGGVLVLRPPPMAIGRPMGHGNTPFLLFKLNTPTCMCIVKSLPPDRGPKGGA